MSQSNLTDITGVIQATLDVGAAGECEATMVGLGTALKDRCKADLAVGVPIVKEAMTGESGHVFGGGWQTRLSRRGDWRELTRSCC